MDEEALERLRQHYRFDEWAGRSRTAARLFVVGHDVGRQVAAAGEVRGVRNIQPAQPALPKATRAFSRPSGTGDDVLVDIQVFECASRAEAHQLLLVVLGEFQSPDLMRRNDIEWGDVCFTTPGEGAVLFVRGNLLHVLRNAGRRRIPLLDVAAALDAPLAQSVAAAPQPKAAKAASRRRKGAAAKAATVAADVGQPVVVPQPKADQEYRIVAYGGEVVREGDAVVYRPDEPGEHGVTVEAVRDSGTATPLEQLRFTVR